MELGQIGKWISMNKLCKCQPGPHFLPKSVRSTFLSDHEYCLTGTMWAAQLRQPSPPLRARTPPPLPPHPLQIIPHEASHDPFIQDRHTFLVN